MSILIILVYAMAMVGTLVVLSLGLVMMLSYWYDFRITIGKVKKDAKTQNASEASDPPENN